MVARDEQTKSHLEGEAAKNIGPSIPRKNVLRYSIARQLIWGDVGGKQYGPHAAVSGGGQDGVSKKAVSVGARNSYIKADQAAHRRGGAIMPGWWIVIPEKLGLHKHSSHLDWGGAPTANSLRIVPYQLASGHEGSNRNSFYIHGTGGHGSDGCILIAPAHRSVLVGLVCEHDGAWLQAYWSGTELNEEIEKGELASHTA